MRASNIFVMPLNISKTPRCKSSSSLVKFANMASWGGNYQDPFEYPKYSMAVSLLQNFIKYNLYKKVSSLHKLRNPLHMLLRPNFSLT